VPLAAFIHHAGTDREKPTGRHGCGKLNRGAVSRASAREWKYIVKVILKELKCGVSENTVFEAFHPDAKDLFNVNCNLCSGQLFWTVHGEWKDAGTSVAAVCCGALPGTVREMFA
jgi:ATP-dependent DNA ligase